MMFSICMMNLIASVLAGPSVETFSAPLYHADVCGARYAPGQAKSPIPLGAVGTGFIEITDAGRFANMTIENNWLQAAPAPAQSGIKLKVGDTAVNLLTGNDPPAAMRFWGHYPAADIDFNDTFPGAAVHMRAFAPLIPHDYEASSMPVALFRFRVTNNQSADLPVELSLQWDQPLAGRAVAEGNVEGALAWRRQALAPGATWSVVARLLHAASRDEALAKINEPVVPGGPLQSAEAPNGIAYSSKDVKDLILDRLGGFNWEDNRRQSAEFNGAPTIGQIFWHLAWAGKTAGRGSSGGYGLAANELPAKTLDGDLQVSMRVQSTLNGAFEMRFDIKNLTADTLRDISFAYSVNADIGGPEKSAKQKAEYVPATKAVLFTAADGASMLLSGDDFDGYVASTWPHAHEQAFAGKWSPVDQAETQQRRVTASIADGIQIHAGQGTVAIAARADDDDWTIRSLQTGDTLVATSATKTLGAGETSTVTLALAWNFPQWLSSDGETLRHKYAAWPDAGAVVAAALPSAPSFEQRIAAWQDKIYKSKAPALLKDALVNSLYILPRNSWWMDDGRFFQSESFTGCPITETFVCRFYGTFPLVLMWPELEKASMQSIAAAQAPSGEIPFGFGSPAGSRSPYFQVQHPIVSSEFVLTAWRNAHLTGDPEFAMYDNVKRALRYAMTLDTDGDGLINEDPGSDKGFPANQYYDIWPWWGTSAYTGGIWLAALRAGEELAKENADNAFAKELRDWFGRASASYEEKLWTGDYYRLYNDPAAKRKSDTILANALCGQWYAYAAALGPILPQKKINAHIDSVLRLNATATEFGTVNGVAPDGKPDITFPDHSSVLTIGETWTFCATAAFAGRTEEALALFQKSYENVLIRQRTPWNIPWSLDPATGAVKWGINYYSNPCVWTLLQAIDPETYISLINP